MGRLEWRLGLRWRLRTHRWHRHTLQPHQGLDGAEKVEYNTIKTNQSTLYSDME